MTTAVKPIDRSVCCAIGSGIGTARPIAVIGIGWFREPAIQLKVISMDLSTTGGLGLTAGLCSV